MIKTVNLQKIFKTEEVQTLALNDDCVCQCGQEGACKKESHSAEDYLYP